MDNCSYFIKDKAIFGSYPTQDSVNELELEGVKYFVDLTDENDTKIIPYSTKFNYIKYPIKDNYVPDVWQKFAKFIIEISKIIRELKEDEKLYLHCRGGHGRSGVVVASILCYLFKIGSEESLKYTSKCHNNRTTMRDKWRKIGSPQTNLQKNFVYKFFSPIKIYHTHKNSMISAFSLISPHKITVENINFDNCQEAIEYFIFDYYEKSENIETEKIKIDIIEIIDNLNKKNVNIIKKIIKNVLEHKIKQHDILLDNLMNSGLRNIIYIYGKDHYLYNGNIIGEVYMKIRNYYYEIF